VANLIQIIVNAIGNADAKLAATAGALGAVEARAASLTAVLVGPGGLAAAGVIVAGALAKMGDELASEVQELEGLSRRTGGSINDLRILRQVMIEAGQSPEALTSALTSLNRNLAQGKKSLIELVGVTRDPIEVLLKLAEAVDRGGNVAKISFDAMGRGGGELAPILSNLSERFNELSGRLGELSPKTIEAAKAWDDMIDRMGTKAKSIGSGIAGGFLRFVDDVGKGLAGIIYTSQRTEELIKLNFGSRLQATQEQVIAMQLLAAKEWEERSRRTILSDNVAERRRAEALIEPPAPDPFLVFRMFPDTGSDKSDRRGVGAAATAEQWRKLVDAWNDAQPIGDRVAGVLEQQRAELELLQDSMASASFNVLDAFDRWAFEGQEAASAIRQAFASAFRDITNHAVQFGLGKLLKLAGTSLGMSGSPWGPIFAGAGKIVGGSSQVQITNNYSALTTRELKQQVVYGGDLARAQAQAGIGSRY
jgi:hypothetical protein